MGTRLKQLLAEGRVIRVFTLGQLIGPRWVEIVALHGGFDAFWLDHEHCGITLHDVAETTRAIRAAGMDSFVRMAPTDYATMMRFLEAGAGGVVAAMIRTPDDAERVVQWVKFGPRGQRGSNTGNVQGNYGLTPLAEYSERMNRETFVAVQIETVEALEQVEEIARVPDVDMLVVGPADLSQALGVTGQFEHPHCIAAIERVADACRNAGIAWGIVPPTPQYAIKMRDLGCRMLVLGSDLAVLHNGIQACKTRCPEFFAD
jgi:2-dehydro-3-deoxyglucarate aldolase/4-hydroxy-2-oxoheptanedioate aldolase